VIEFSIFILARTSKALDVEIRVSYSKAALKVMPQASNNFLKPTQRFDLGFSKLLQCLLTLANFAKLFKSRKVNIKI
jgi:hypothetical protein